ncbi:helix-turn-helix domain-containing protein [Cloacibacterium sp.]|uniref:helix-turn-helix domain-containing protein n=1 Tax=Cloacibacterium sp. TaxID=1913682 RepID=UPI0039E68A40
MTNLGKIFKEKLVNKSAISRITGISSARLSELSRNENTVMKAKELYLIALALEISVEEIAEKLYGHLKLEKIK